MIVGNVLAVPRRHKTRSLEGQVPRFSDGVLTTEIRNFSKRIRWEWFCTASNVDSWIHNVQQVLAFFEQNNSTELSGYSFLKIYNKHAPPPDPPDPKFDCFPDFPGFSAGTLFLPYYIDQFQGISSVQSFHVFQIVSVFRWSRPTSYNNLLQAVNRI